MTSCQQILNLAGDIGGNGPQRCLVGDSADVAKAILEMPPYRDQQHGVDL